MKYPPNLKSGRSLTAEEVRECAAHIVREVKYDQRKNQTQIAEDIGVSQGNLSSAINKSGTRWLKTQLRIIEQYTPYTVRAKTQWDLVKKDG